MATTPTFRDWTAGEVAAAAYLNTDVRDAGNFFLSPPSAFIYKSGADQSINNDTWTAITMNAEDFDTDSMHSTSVNTERITCVTPGIYLLHGSLRFTANATGKRGAEILYGATGAEAARTIHPATATGDHYIDVTRIFQIATVDAPSYFQLQGYQNSGGALNVMRLLNNGGTSFSASWLSKAAA